MTLRLVAASANPGKVAEMAALLAGAGAVLEPRPAGLAEVAEDADTLVGNARLKAQAVVDAAGAAALADDTGLEVDALGGAPGVRSARYAGEGASDADNVSKLLDALEASGAAAASARTARFRTVMVVRWPDGRELCAEGAAEGVIALDRRGEHGFGYDSVFVPTEGDGRTFAEMTAAEKNAISHRGRALRALVDAVRAQNG